MPDFNLGDQVRTKIQMESLTSKQRKDKDFFLPWIETGAGIFIKIIELKFTFGISKIFFQNLPNVFCNNFMPFCSWMNPITLV